MTTMTAIQMVDHIKSKKGHIVSKYKPNTDRYDTLIGLYRMIFNIVEEPEAMVMIAGKTGVELWLQIEDKSWLRKF